MRRFTALLNLATTFALLAGLYTGLDTLTHKADPAYHAFIAFIAIITACIATANSMMYINTLHKDIDELKKKLEGAKNVP